MILTLGRHMQVLMETPESIARREDNSRRPRRYSLACTCESRRREDGHCVHTLVLFENNLNPKRWRYVTPEPMKAKAGPVGDPVRPRLEVERELVALRAALRRIAEEPPDRGLTPDFRQFARDALAAGPNASEVER